VPAHPVERAAGALKPGVSTSAYSSSPSTVIGKRRQRVVVPGSGLIATESSEASVETMLDFPLLG